MTGDEGLVVALDDSPSAPAPRLVFFTIIPVLVLAVLGYASYQTIRHYEWWKLPPNRQEGSDQAPSWPLTGDGFWHRLRPVRRLQLLHLAGAGGLLGFYLAFLPSSHPTARTAAAARALALVVLAAGLLIFPQTRRTGVNPDSVRVSDMDLRPGPRSALSHGIPATQASPRHTARGSNSRRR